ncbi:CPBP family intramembrane glutamic endopeptidase [Aeromicrobium sp. 179-A 4D2 NHS]|uniref:CPBP family intramembrane glutamic endopeptidase n=1 Tax=Aeromicrobium sp. 179-A 4D2 NHS TaxID=3142375 RepID=UPI0039A16F52
MTVTEATGRRRGWVVVTLVVGAAALAFTLNRPTGDDLFLVTGYAMAAVWAGGALLSGPIPRSDAGAGRAALIGAAVGAVLLGACLVVAVLIADVPALAEPADELLEHADGALLPVLLMTAVNGVGEEMFFRGALHDSLPRRWAWLVSTAVYTLTTAGSGIALLVLAAAMLGGVTAFLRERTGGLAAPIATHLVWSLGMLLLLPHALAIGR